MPRKISEDALEGVVRTLGQFPAGASVTEIEQALDASVPRRTLQRWLSKLVEQGRVVSSGQGRAVRYRLPERQHDTSDSVATIDVGAEGDGEPYVPLSREGEEVRMAVRRPRRERRPVGYNPEFLDGYRPNQTRYLTADQSHRLAEMGASPDAKRPAGTYARKLYDRLLIDLSWNSSRLEGNTYSLLETERLLQFGEVAEGKDAREAQMILNHREAIEFLVEQASEMGFNRYTILNLHALLSNNLMPDSQACGRLRRIAVGIDGSVYHPLEVPQQIEELFDQILDTAFAINDPFEQSFFAMVHLPYLQPFEDVNKRVSRLAANIPLIRSNFCPLSFIDVPERAYVDGLLGVYELNRIELLRDVFLWAYERSCARYAAIRSALGDPDPFRLRYRDQIRATVADVVRRCRNMKQAIRTIQEAAQENLPAGDRRRFVEVVESELDSLHEGNIARYRLRPSEFEQWLAHWR